MELVQKDISRDASTHLVVIIDISPDSQILRKEAASRKDAANKSEQSPYQDWISSIIAFCNAHLMLDHRNQLTVIISGLDNNQIVFPTKKSLDDRKSKKSLEGQYELFSEVSSEVLNKIKEMIGNTKSVLERMSNGNTTKQFSSVLAGSVAIGLCRIQRLSESVDESRICIITSSRETPAFYASQYMNFMNGFFSAQKMRVAIDCCAVDDTNELLTNSILQQGCDLTNGFYLKISNVAATLEYLMWVFLPGVETRKKMILPTKTKISYKASCFCHRNQVDIGYVCSVCLSIFCQFSPICSTCQTVFKLGPEPNVKVKKRKTATP